jgi:hypothetical protein
MSMPTVEIDPAVIENKIRALPQPRAGRPRGSKNQPGHHAGRPRKHPKEVFAPSIWEHGKAEISVLQKHIDRAKARSSSHCAIAMAIKDAVPHAKFISVDLQTIRWTDPRKGVRFCFLSPHVAQALVIGFDSRTAKPASRPHFG